MTIPETYGLSPTVHPRACSWVAGVGLGAAPLPAASTRYTSHRFTGTGTDRKPGTSDVGFGAVVGGFYPGGATTPKGSKAWPVGINPARMIELGARWPTPEDARAEFLAALYGSDPVELDLVFARAHALHRWDLLPGWYAEAWAVRGTVRRFDAEKPAPALIAKKPAPTGWPGYDLFSGYLGGLEGLAIDSFDSSGSPIVRDVPKSWAPWKPITGEVVPLSALSAPQVESIFFRALTGSTGPALGDGFDTLPGTSSSVSTSATWSRLWNDTKHTLGLVPAKFWWYQTDKAKQSEPWSGPIVSGLVALANAADDLVASSDWQDKAKKWWKQYLAHGAPFGFFKEAGYIPQPWLRPTVTYRPHWWVVDASFLEERVGPKVVLTTQGLGVEFLSTAASFQAAIVEWIQQDAHVADPVAWWAHIGYENLADQDIGDFLELVVPIAFLAVAAPALASSMVGAFGVAGSAFGAALGDGLAATLSAGLQAEASGGTFGDGFDELLDEPLELLGELGLAAASDLFDIPDEIIDDPLGELAEEVGSAVGLSSGTIETLDELVDLATSSNPIDAVSDFFDDFLPDSFGEALEFGETALEVAELVDSFFDFFDDDPATGGIGETFQNLGDVLEDFAGGTPPTLPPDIGPGDVALALSESKPSIPLGTTAVVGLLLIGAVLFLR